MLYWLVALFGLSLAVDFYDKSTNEPIVSLSNWSPSVESCGNGVSADYSLFPAHFEFLDMKLEVCSAYDAYLLSHGNLMHVNPFSALLLTENVSAMSFDHFENMLYYISNGSLFNFSGFVDTVSPDVIDFEVVDGLTLFLYKNGTIMFNGQRLLETTHPHLCLYPRKPSPSNKWILIPIVLFCLIPFGIRVALSTTVDEEHK